MRTHQQSGFQIWRWPTLIAVLSVFGLLSALLGQGGIWWWFSWTALAIPLLVVTRYWARSVKSAGSSIPPTVRDSS